MDVITLAKGEPDRKARVDPNGGIGADIEIATGEITGDGGGFLFSKIPRPLVGTESRSGCSGEGAIIVIVLLVIQVRRSLQCCIHRRRGKLNIGGSYQIEQ